MNAGIESKSGPVKNRTTVERKSDREVVVTRTINGPAHRVRGIYQGRAARALVGAKVNGNDPAVL